MKNKKVILITGVTGFLGSHLLHKILACTNGEYSVIGLKRSFSNISRIGDCLNNPALTLIDIDLLENGYSEIFEEHDVSIIIHTATDYGRDGALSSKILESNLIFPLMLLEEGIKHGLRLFINTDSYFNKPNQSYKTLLDYSLSKKSLNLWLEYYAAKVKIVNLRLEHVYGMFDSQTKFCEMIIRSIAIRQDSDIALTGGAQKRDFVFIDDVCNAYMTVLENYEKYFFNHLVFDVGTGETVSVRDFVEYVRTYSRSKSVLHFGSIPYRDDEIMISYADTSGLRNWGFLAQTSYQEGIKKIVDVYTPPLYLCIVNCCFHLLFLVRFCSYP